MSDPLPQVPCDAPVERVTHLLSHEGPAVFVVMGEGRFEILTKYDLMGTIAELMEQSALDRAQDAMAAGEFSANEVLRAEAVAHR